MTSTHEYYVVSFGYISVVWWTLSQFAVCEPFMSVYVFESYLTHPLDNVCEQAINVQLPTGHWYMPTSLLKKWEMWNPSCGPWLC